MKDSSHQFSSFSLKQRLASLRNISQQDANGFTLVELIVVILMIGILYSIAIPQFMSAANKAKQKEASTIVGATLRAVGAYYTEYGSTPENINELTEFARFQECAVSGADNDTTGGAKKCKGKVPGLAAGTGTTWVSPSGNYECRIKGEQAVGGKTLFQITCDPNGSGYSGDGGAVQGCYNSDDSTVLVKEWQLNDSEKGKQSAELNCSAKDT